MDEKTENKSLSKDEIKGLIAELTGQIEENRKAIEKLKFSQVQTERVLFKLQRELAADMVEKATESTVSVAETTTKAGEMPTKTIDTSAKSFEMPVDTYVMSQKTVCNPENPSENSHRAGIMDFTKTTVNRTGSYKDTTPKKGKPSSTTVSYEMPDVKKRDTETLFGKNMMAFAASVLIFVSIILFATVMLKNLSDSIRFGAMIVFSLAVTAVGIFKMSKEKSVFWLAITGCGAGAMYISLFAGNMYFGLLSETLLFVLLLIWAASVLLLSLEYGDIFVIIGEAGIVISMVFGTVFCVQENDPDRFSVLITYFYVGSIAYFVFTIRRGKQFVINSAINIIAVLSLLLGAILFKFDGDADVSMHMIAITVYVILLIGCLIFSMDEDRLKAQPALAFLYSAMYYFLAVVFLEDRFVDYCLLFALGSALILCFSEFCYTKKIKKTYDNKKIPLYIFETALILIAAFSITASENVLENGGELLIIIALLAYGIWKYEDFYTAASVILSGAMLFMDDFFWGIDLLQTVCVPAAVLVLMYVFKNRYTSWIRNLSTTILYLGIAKTITGAFRYFEWNLTITGSNLRDMVILLVIAILHILVMKSGFLKDWQFGNEERGSRRYFYVVTAVLAIFALVNMSVMADPFCKMLTIFTGLALVLLNADDFLRNEKATAAHIYTGVKITFYILWVLEELDASQALTSVIMILFALICVAVGFAVSRKAVRIYGLVLSMICIVKLLVFDISYSDTLGRALSFFISGVLCFGISALYSYIDKKTGKKD